MDGGWLCVCVLQECLVMVCLSATGNMWGWLAAVSRLDNAACELVCDAVASSVRSQCTVGMPDGHC